MKTQPWNAKKVVSKKIMGDDWKQLLSVCPESKTYILKSLKTLGNVPLEKEALAKTRANTIGTSSTQHDVYRDIQTLNNCLRYRGLAFSIRVTKGIYSRNPKVQVCKTKSIKPIQNNGAISFEQAMGRVKQEILSHPNPVRFYVISVLPNLCP